MLLDHGTRNPQLSPPIRARLRDTHLLIQAQFRSNIMATTSTGKTHVTIAQRSSHLYRIPSYFFLSCIRLRRLHHQNLGLRTRRNRTHHKRPHQSRPFPRLRRSPRRHTPRFLFLRSNNQTLGPKRRIQKHPYPPRPRPLRLRHTLHSFGRRRQPTIRESPRFRLPRQNFTHLGREHRILCEDYQRTRRLGARRCAKF